MLKREGGISVQTSQQKRASSRVEGRISCFFSRMAGSSQIMTGTSGTRSWASGMSSLHASCEGPLRIPVQSLLWPRSSSKVEAGTSGFCSHGNMDLGVPLGFTQGSQASSHVETCKSALLSSWKTSVRLPVGLTKGLMAFCPCATGLSHPPSCFESILGVTVDSVARELYLQCFGISGSFEMLARPLKFLLSFKWRPPPLEVRLEHRDSFPDKAGKWTLLSFPITSWKIGGETVEISVRL